MEIVSHSKNSVFQQQFQKKLRQFNRHELGFPTYECDVKNDLIGFQSRTKNSTPQPWSKPLVYIKIIINPSPRN